MLVLRSGGYSSPAPQAQKNNRLQLQIPSTPAGFFKPYEPQPGKLDLWVWPSIMFFDGRLANRQWMQEVPEPVAYIGWGAWADMNPQTAHRLSVYSGEIIQISNGKQVIKLPVNITEEVAPDTVACLIGQGHTSPWLSIASGIGDNPFELLSYQNSLAQWAVNISKTGKSVFFAREQTTKDQHNREIIKIVNLDEFKRGIAKQDEIIWPLPRGYKKWRDLYPSHPHKEHRWAMVIDLQKCTGCQACSVACYAENNIDAVGKYQVERGREMAWLKVIPYYTNNITKEIAWLPLLCQHCDAAPCEPVCPTYASVHMENGLNAQIYNRCIGTRDCMNNCPYKVRRFNWLNPQLAPYLQNAV